jgi:type II secretory pathway pseudopilin PulG
MRQGGVQLVDDAAPPEHDPPPARHRRRWLRREAIDLGDVVVQIFAVVVGILLALFINNLVTQRQQQATVDDAMRAIRVELSANRIALRGHARQMFAMARNMRDAPSNRNRPPRFCYLWDGFRGIGGYVITDAAYQTAIATQALANMSFKQAQVVSEIYGWQHYYQKGVDLDVNMLTERAQPLDYCVEMVEEIGTGNLRLDAIYARLIGTDKVALPSPPSPSSPRTTTEPPSTSSSPRNSP